MPLLVLMWDEITDWMTEWKGWPVDHKIYMSPSLPLKTDINTPNVDCGGLGAQNVSVSRLIASRRLYWTVKMKIMQHKKMYINRLPLHIITRVRGFCVLFSIIIMNSNCHWQEFQYFRTIKIYFINDSTAVAAMNEQRT